MSKVLSPLFSTDASGAFADSIIFRHNAGHCAGAKRFAVKSSFPEITHFRNQVFEHACFQWANSSADVVSQWYAYAEKFFSKKNSPFDKKLTASNLFIQSLCNAAIYNLPFSYLPPLTPSTNYHPFVAVEWTASGALLTLTAPVPDWHRVVIRERRNLKDGSIRARAGNVAYVFTGDDEPPYFISAGLEVPDVPPGFPSIIGGTYLRWDFFTIDNSIRRSVDLCGFIECT